MAVVIIITLIIAFYAFCEGVYRIYKMKCGKKKYEYAGQNLTSPVVQISISALYLAFGIFATFGIKK